MSTAAHQSVVKLLWLCAVAHPERGPEVARLVAEHLRECRQEARGECERCTEVSCPHARAVHH